MSDVLDETFDPFSADPFDPAWESVERLVKEYVGWHTTNISVEAWFKNADPESYSSEDREWYRSMIMGDVGAAVLRAIYSGDVAARVVAPLTLQVRRMERGEFCPASPNLDDERISHGLVEPLIVDTVNVGWPPRNSPLVSAEHLMKDHFRFAVLSCLPNLLKNVLPESSGGARSTTRELILPRPGLYEPAFDPLRSLERDQASGRTPRLYVLQLRSIDVGKLMDLPVSDRKMKALGTMRTLTPQEAVRRVCARRPDHHTPGKVVQAAVVSLLDARILDPSEDQMNQALRESSGTSGPSPRRSVSRLLQEAQMYLAPWEDTDP